MDFTYALQWRLTSILSSPCTVDIRITKKGSRNLLACARPDGTAVSADLGPNLPHHDLAHFVVERAFGLSDGFFGNIGRGYTPAQLSDKHVIRSLGVEPYRAEILARALGSLHTGACSPEQFEDLVNAELTSLGLPRMLMPPVVRDALLAEFEGHLAAYQALRDGDSMTLFFNTSHRSVAMPDLQAVFKQLKSVMAPYAKALDAKRDDESELYVDTRHIQKNKKALFFGAVQIKKSFVAYHLMPVYVKPELLKGISPELKARMQGKSCFNFAEVDKPLFKELAALTKTGFASYKDQGFV